MPHSFCASRLQAHVSRRATMEIFCIMRPLFALLITAVVVSLTASPAPADTSTMEKSAAVMQSKSAAPRIKQLHDLLAEQWEYTLRTNPEFASILGDKRYNDKLGDYSQAAIERDIRQ